MDGANSKQAHGKSSQSWSWESEGDLRENQITASPEENKLLHKTTENTFNNKNNQSTVTVTVEQVTGTGL